jgi:uncharacterized membrane protein YwzB
MKLALYTLMLALSIYAVSGINFNGIIKTNRKFEAVFLQILLSLSLAYASSSLLLAIIDSSMIIK